MGLTIFYSGKIRDMRQLPALTEEVMDICDNIHWISGYFNPVPEIPLTGFQFHPPGSEPIWMTFQSDELLADPIYFIFRDDPFAPPDPKSELWLSSVTQYAGMDAHIAIIKLLKYLQGKYFEKLRVSDESEYWETGDIILCKERFDQYEIVMDEMAEKLSQLDGKHGLSGDSVQNRLDDLIHTRGLEDILRALK
jgi:hypothetical protein